MLLPIVASADAVEIDGIYYNLITKAKQAEVTQNPNKYSGEVIIAKSVVHSGVEYSVTSIGGNAFIYCSGLTSVTIPHSVTSIGGSAFSGCSGLTSVTIPHSVTSIGGSAFSGCSGLTSVTIPNSVTSIGGSAFSGCSGLTNVTIPNSVTSIGGFAFSGCSGLTNVTIPNSVTSIGRSAFNACSGLTSLTIPNSVTSIGDDAFRNCSGLTSLTIPNSVTSIGSSAFSGCSGLTSISIGNNVTSIGRGAFSGCNGLTSVHISDIAAWCKIIFDYDNYSGIYSNPLYYAHHLFLNEKEINNLVIPENVTSIGKYAFIKCSGLTSVTIPKSITKIGDGAFYGCNGLTSVYISDVESWCKIEFGQTKEYDYSDYRWDDEYDDEYIVYYKYNYSNPLSYAHHLFINGKEIEELNISDNITFINDYAFHNCVSLTSITFPNSMTDIGRYAFSGCCGLLSVNSSIGVTSIGEGAFFGCENLSSVNISDLDSWCKINFNLTKKRDHYGPWEFYEYSNPLSYAQKLYLNGKEITDLILPNSVTSINDYAFHNCSSLISVIIPNNVTSIGNYAFEGCSALVSVTIGSGVKNINNYAIASCPELTDVYCLAKKVPYSTQNSFSGSLIKYATLHVPETSVDAYMKQSPWNEFGSIVSLESTTTYLLTYLLDNNNYKQYSLKYGANIIPESIPEKEGYTFSGWTGLPETMPDHDVTVTGTFSINKYRLTYCVDGEVYAAYDIDYGATITPEAEPAKEGYTFSGWSEIPATMPANDVTVTGTFSINQYKLTYVVNGEEYKMYEVEYGTSITPEEAPTKVGYDFTGWSEIPETMPAHDVTITGYFEQNSPTEAVEIDGIYYNLVRNAKTAEVTKNPSRYSGDIVIPESVTYGGVQYSVDSIGVKAFFDCYDLTSVTIPNSVTSIGDYAFQVCSGITSVKIPNSVTKIGFSAFAGCSGLTSVTIPNSVTSIGDGAFSYCSGLTSLTISNSVTSINHAVFANCSGLTSVTIPNSVTSIGLSVFRGCSGLTSVTIPNSVTSIGTEAFAGCSGLTSITIPNSVTSIGGSSFSGCSGLTSVTIPNSVTSIPGGAFSGCNNLTTINIGSGVKSIGGWAFAKCSKLTDVYCFAESVPETTIDAFQLNKIDYATLHVPESALEAYKVAIPWKTFGKIVALDGTTTSYNLTYMLDNEVYKQYSLESGTTISPEPAPTKDGYTFSGWSEIPETMPTNDVTVTGSFTVNQYRLTYYVDSEVYTSYDIDYGAVITPEAEPTKDGYSFSGWSEIPETMPAHDVTVTGSFEPHYDVGNVASLIDVILNGNGSVEDFELYDMNDDGELNIGDLILIMREVLKNTGGSAPSRGVVEWVEPDFTQYTAAQFVLDVPLNVREQDIQLAEGIKQTHKMMSRQIVPGRYAVVVYSLTNSKLAPGFIEVKAEMAHAVDLDIKDMVLAKPTGETASFGNMAVATVVSDVRRENAQRSVYDLKGQKQGNSLQKGVYIENGKKIVIR